MATTITILNPSGDSSSNTYITYSRKRARNQISLFGENSNDKKAVKIENEKDEPRTKSPERLVEYKKNYNFTKEIPETPFELWNYVLERAQDNNDFDDFISRDNKMKFYDEYGRQVASCLLCWPLILDMSMAVEEISSYKMGDAIAERDCIISLLKMIDYSKVEDESDQACIKHMVTEYIAFSLTLDFQTDYSSWPVSYPIEFEFDNDDFDDEESDESDDASSYLMQSGADQ